MRDLRTRAGVALAGLGLLALSACSSSNATDFTGDVIDPPFTVDPTALTDTDGASYSLTDSTDKRLTMVFFGYTNCPDICGTVMLALTSGLSRLDDADRSQVDVVFVTTDPARDDGPTLRSYLDRYDPSYVGLTGDLDTIVEVGRSVGAGVSDGQQLPTGGYDLNTHTTRVIGIDGGDEAPVMWDQETSSAQYAADIHTLLGEA